MVLKFRGDHDELKKIMLQADENGEWRDVSGNQKQYRSSSGAIVNWWLSTGTIQVQGDPTDVKRLEGSIKQALESQVVTERRGISRTAGQKLKIFVVHGHDDIARDQLELVLRRLGLDPFVLMNTAGGGMTIIEALESQIGKRGEAEFGIVLMTPDDMGYAKKEGEKEIKARARQNVILEMGMLLSSLTRGNVAILVKGYVELPSDASGIIYLHFNEHVKEVVPKLAERLQACGISIDAKKIANASQ